MATTKKNCKNCLAKKKHKKGLSEIPKIVSYINIHKKK